MSCLPMSVVSLTRSILNTKWETRRHWSGPRVSVGGSYRILRMGVDGLFCPRERAPAFAIVNDWWTEPLGAIDAASLEAEGGYTFDEFVTTWRELHPEMGWKPDEEIYVVDYDTVLEDPDAD